MPQISYTPVFQLPNWRDNIDRVSADGPNGFNVQFTGLLNEFNQLSNVVSQLNAAIAAVGTPPPTKVTITFTPTLTQTDATPWTHSPGLATKPAGATSAHGMMSLGLPSGVTVLSLRLSGQNSDSSQKNPANGILLARLLRQSLKLDGTPPDPMVTVQGTGVTFDTSGNVDAQFAKVDNDHKYFIIAQLDNALQTDVVQISGFQIAYMTA
jgi:hypothetical protein